MKVAFAESETLRLTAYKLAVLGVEADGIYAGDRRPRPHILPKELERLNILAAVREEFWRWFDARRGSPDAVTLHRDFHHLNSSQALCFNLFFPLMLELRRAPQSRLPIPGFGVEEVVDTRFEYVPNRKEGTNFDFMMALNNAGTPSRIFFEIKYTERDFGGIQKSLGAAFYQSRFDEVYSLRLAGRFQEKYCSTQGFLEHYQILRNLWHLDLNARDAAVFLFPRANTSLHRREEIIRNCLRPPFQDRAKVIYIEDLLGELEANTDLGAAYKTGALAEFKAKYFPTN